MGSVLCGKIKQKISQKINNNNNNNNENNFQRIYTNESKEKEKENLNKKNENNIINIKSIYTSYLEKSPKSKLQKEENKNIESLSLNNNNNNNLIKNSPKSINKSNPNNNNNLSQFSHINNINTINIKSNITSHSLKSFSKNEKIMKIKEKFYLTLEDINKLHNFFCLLDKENSGFITIVDIYRLLNENPSTSIIGPFIDRFFVLIEKKNFYKTSFEEFLPNLVSFCLFSTFQLIEFMFNFIDKDHDNYISKGDIRNILILKREENDIYMENSIKAMENIKGIKRIDKINLEEFFEICKKMPFLFHPLIILQDRLKEKYLGNKFWEDLNISVREKYTNKLKILENDRINMQIFNLQNKLIQNKKKKMKISDKKDEDKIYHEKIRSERRNSDTAFFIGKYEEFKEFRENQFKEAKSFQC